MLDQITQVFDYAALSDENRIVIRQKTGEIRERVDTIQRCSIEVGQRLIEVKQRLGHGQFGAWLAAEFQWSQDTAGNLMNVARLAEQNPKISDFADQFARSALYLLASPSTPNEARAAALQRAADGEKITRANVLELIDEQQAVALTAEELLELQRAVRRRGGVYAGERRVNGVITRHLVTLPGQPERAYPTPALREALSAFAEREEALPADLSAAWELHEHAALLVARHRATGVATEPGLLIQVRAEARDYQPDLDRLHAAGWTFRRYGEEWEARHPTFGAAMAERVPLLVWQAVRVADAHREQQARELIDQAAWDAAEQVILTVQHAGTKDALMGDFSRAYRAAQSPTAPGVAALKALPDPEGAFSDPEPQFSDREPAGTPGAYHLPADFAAVQAQAAPVATLAMQMQDGAFRLTPAGQPVERFAHGQWEQVKVRVALLVAAAQTNPAVPTPDVETHLRTWLNACLVGVRGTGTAIHPHGADLLRLIASALGLRDLWEADSDEVIAALREELIRLALVDMTDVLYLAPLCQAEPVIVWRQPAGYEKLLRLEGVVEDRARLATRQYPPVGVPTEHTRYVNANECRVATSEDIARLIAQRQAEIAVAAPERGKRYRAARQAADEADQMETPL